MNCKPGDLAMIVMADGDHNLGKVVTCVVLLGEKNISRPRGKDRLICWEIDPPLPDWSGKQMANFAPDAWLLPIRHPGDDAKDEMLRPLPKEVGHA